MRGRRLLPAAAAGIALACATVGTVRPAYRPLPDAFVDTIRVDRAEEIVAVIEAGVREAGFDLETSSALDGYVVTRWYDLARQRSVGGDAADPHGLVRLRFWLDPIGPLGFQITSEAVHRRRTDPSLPARQLERMVPPGHQTEGVLVTILDSLRVRFGG